MKLKRYSLGALIAGVVLFVGSFVVPWVLAFRLSAGQGSVGIIGGADGPTAIFITGSLGGIVSTVLLIAGCICGIIAIAKVVKKGKK